MLGASPLYVATQLEHVGQNRETLHHEQPRLNGRSEKSQLIAGFPFVPPLKFLQVVFLNLLKSSKSEPEILVGGASFELATPAV